MGKKSRKNNRKAAAKKAKPSKTSVVDLQGIMQKAKQARINGRIEEAEQKFSKVVERKPDHADALHHLGEIANTKGEFQKSRDLVQKSLSVKSDNLEAWINLGFVEKNLGDYGSAIQSFHQAVQIDAGKIDLMLDFAHTLYEANYLKDSLQCFQIVIEYCPEEYLILARLADACKRLEEYEQAEFYYKKTLQIATMHADPMDSNSDFVTDSEEANLYLDLGYVQNEQGKWEEAKSSFEKALEFDPESFRAYYNLGYVLKNLGGMEEAYNLFQKALELRPEDEDVSYEQFVCLNYLPGIGALRIKKEHEKWGEYIASNCTFLTEKGYVGDKKMQSPLRIGFVSGDLRMHPIGFFLFKLFMHRDPQKVLFYCYSNNSEHDALNSMLWESSDVWAEVGEMGDEDLSRRIYEDGIDVLFDLSGYTQRNRLAVFARRPAQIQITWAGYVGTTGLPTMDYLLADDVHVPYGEESAYREDILRMPEGFAYVTYSPPAYAPQVGPLPAEENNYITFASFQNPAKINSCILKLWSRILNSLPNSCLVLQYRGMDRPYHKSRIQGFMQQAGIDPQRIICRHLSHHPDLFASYNQVDITLDTHPYSGGLTTLESLWMGVPVITLPGDTFASRHSASYLSRVGLEELIAGNEEEYISLAISLARDLNRLSEIRFSLRECMTNSVLMDWEKWTREFESLMWQVVSG